MPRLWDMEKRDTWRHIGPIAHNVTKRIVNKRIRSYRLTCCEQAYRVVKLKPIKHAGKIVGMAREEVEPAKGGAVSTKDRPAPSPQPPREVGDVVEGE